jgi:hypothetical protein
MGLWRVPRRNKDKDMKLTERKEAALAISGIALLVLVVAMGFYSESTWQQIQYSGTVTSFYVKATIPGWMAYPLPGNTTYYGMTVLLANGTSIPIEISGACIPPGFGVGSPVFVAHNTGLWNPSTAWILFAPRAAYCSISGAE